jgi:hypothetical protein
MYAYEARTCEHGEASVGGHADHHEYVGPHQPMSAIHMYHLGMYMIGRICIHFTRTYAHMCAYEARTCEHGEASVGGHADHHEYVGPHQPMSAIHMYH